MGFLIRIGGLIGGVLLLIIGIGGGVLHNQTQKIYWVYSLSDNRQRAPYVMLFDNHNPEPQLIRELAINSPKQLIWSSDGNQLFYVDDGADFSSLWRVRPLGGDPQPVLHNLVDHTYVDLLASPDGQFLAILTQDEWHGRHIILTDKHAENPRRLVSIAQGISHIFWLPDSKWIYYETQEPGSSTAQTYRINVDGGESDFVFQGRIYRPIWSQDLEWMVFVVNTASNATIKKISTDGEIIIDLVANMERGSVVRAWLPTDWLIFETSRYSPDTVPYRIRPDGTGLERLTAESSQVISWTPDGRTLFLGRRGEAADCVLFQIDLSTLDQTCLWTAARRFWFGGEITIDNLAGFVASPLGERENDYEVSTYVVDRDGSNIREIYRMPSSEAEWYGNNMPDNEWYGIYLPEYVSRETSWKQFRIRLSDGEQFQLPNGLFTMASPLLHVQMLNIEQIMFGGILGLFPLFSWNLGKK